MLRLLKFLFSGSWHECNFQQIDHHKCNTWDSNHAIRPVEIVHTYVSRCDCGAFKTKKVSL